MGYRNLDWERDMDGDDRPGWTVGEALAVLIAALVLMFLIGLYVVRFWTW